MPMLIDHLVYATSDVEQSINELETRLGIRASLGGQHAGKGTRNALLALGPCTYLEIVGPDHAQPAPASPRWFNIDTITAPGLVTWAAHGSALAQLAESATHSDVHIGDVLDGNRTRPDGVQLHWQYTNPIAMLADGLVPFFIDWGLSPHPAAQAAQGLTLAELRAEHASPDSVLRMLDVLNVVIPVKKSSASALCAIIDGPKGRIELR